MCFLVLSVLDIFSIMILFEPLVLKWEPQNATQLFSLLYIRSVSYLLSLSLAISEVSTPSSKLLFSVHLMMMMMMVQLFFIIQVSILLWAKDCLCDLAPVTIHQGLQCPLSQICAPNPVQQREGRDVLKPESVSQMWTVVNLLCFFHPDCLFCYLPLQLSSSAIGDRWVHSTGQRQELWDHDEVWKKRSQPGC